MDEEHPKTIHQMDNETVMHMLRGYSRNIGLLAKRGDPLSKVVKLLYEDMFEHPKDMRVRSAFRDAFRDWMRQHLEITSRVELARKYGYLVEGEDPRGPTPTVIIQ